jgi:hypothetical protein
MLIMLARKNPRSLILRGIRLFRLALIGDRLRRLADGRLIRKAAVFALAGREKRRGGTFNNKNRARDYS